MAVSFKGKNLTIDGKVVEMELPIKAAVEHDSGVILVVMNEMEGRKCALPPGDPRIDRNIIGVDTAGRILWRIEQSERLNGYDGDGKPGHMLNDWVRARIKPDGTVRVCDFGGMSFVLDPKTGALSDPEFVK